MRWMTYNFDEVVNRRNTNCIKWDTQEDDVLPMWIADMDFKSPDEVIEALVERAKEGVFGYNFRQDGFYDSIINWVKKKFDWEIKRDWIVFTPGVVTGFNIGIRALTDEDDGVLIQTPVYPPFKGTIDNIGRKLRTNPLIIKDGKYQMDYDDLENKLKESKALLLCSPHNPVGRVWTKDELEKLSKLCVENDVYIISDEIHCDLAYKANKHTMIASLSEEMANRTITLIAPSKTFNIAGLFTSVAIIPNEEIRNKVNAEIAAVGIDHTSIFGALGLEAAYTYGEAWLDELLDYLEGNADYVVDFIKEHIPEVKIIKPDGTFLLWLDFSSLGLSQDELIDLMLNKAKVNMNDGTNFGEEGRGFLRMNIGTSRANVEEGLKRIEKAVKANHR